MPSVNPHKFHEFYGDKRTPAVPEPEARPVRSYRFDLRCTQCRGVLLHVADSRPTRTESRALVRCRKCHTTHLISCQINPVVDPRPAIRQLDRLTASVSHPPAHTDGCPPTTTTTKEPRPNA